MGLQIERLVITAEVADEELATSSIIESLPIARIRRHALSDPGRCARAETPRSGRFVTNLENVPKRC